jgi:hypothetical protein
MASCKTNERLGSTLGLMRKRILLATVVAVLAGCSNATTSAKRNHPTPTPKPSPTALAITFNNCGSATYTEPSPPGVTPKPNATPAPTPQDAWGSPVTNADALSFVHQLLASDKSISHDTVTCSAQQFAAAAVVSYMGLSYTPSTDVFVVVVRLQPSGQGRPGTYKAFFLTSVRPVSIYAASVYTPSTLPGIFKGI